MVSTDAVVFGVVASVAVFKLSVVTVVFVPELLQAVIERATNGIKKMFFIICDFNRFKKFIIHSGCQKFSCQTDEKWNSRMIKLLIHTGFKRRK